MNKLDLQKELNLALIAWAFFTRIPVPKWVDFSQTNLNKASRYFSLVGWCVGLLCGGCFLLFEQILNNQLAIIMSMLFGILLTSSFHEDGLADTCDGFGGGWEKQQKLLIMKDSRLGTYGAVAIWFALSLKFVALNQIQNIGLPLIVAHSLSRSISTSLIYSLPYVTDDGLSKVKPLAEKLKLKDLLINLGIGLLSLLLLPSSALLIVLMLLIVFFVLSKLYRIQIGGFTGDTLGAAQQIAEVVIYLTIIGVSDFNASDGLVL